MSANKLKKSRLLTTPVFALVLFAAANATFAQDTTNNSSTNPNTPTNTTQNGATTNGTAASATTSADARSRTVSNGERMKIKGVITRRDADTFTVRDLNGVDTSIRLADTTRVTERKSNPFRRAKDYGTTNILRGLNVEVEGRGDASGQLVADTVKFSEDELKVARTVESRVNPVEDRLGAGENRLGQVEQNAQRISGQIDELAAVSNAAKGGARAAQETADAAVAGVGTTNERISALDDYVPQDMMAVNFRPGSAVLSPQAKSQLDQIANKAFSAKGYVIEVSGYADSTGNMDVNRRLSQQRADAVVRYLAEEHRIPLRRIITPFGFGQSQAVADNHTREGRAQNRRVEVKVLVNRGLMQTAPAMNTQSTNSGATPNQ